jgi:hypothetical protein
MVREHKGQMHEVMVVPGGLVFDFNGVGFGIGIHKLPGQK